MRCDQCFPRCEPAILGRALGAWPQRIAELEEAASLEDPTDMAEPMTNNLRGLWSYRIAGGYRMIMDIRRDRMVTLAGEAGPRDKVYKKDV